MACRRPDDISIRSATRSRPISVAERRAATAREARASIEAGEPLIPWEQVKADAGL
jgi:hypothetical protein